MNCMNCGGPLTAGVKFCPKCGTPAPQPAPYTPPPNQVHTSWNPAPGVVHGAAPARRKSRAGKILLIIFAVFLLLAGGAALAAYFGFRYLGNSLKSSEAYQAAEAALRSSTVASERLGKIESTGFPLGTYSADANGTGAAAFTMSVEGTKSSARYVATLERRGGTWYVTNAFLQMPDNELVPIVGEAGAGDTDPPPPTAPIRPQTPPAGTVSGGALDAKAISKPAPAYPPIAKTVHASGTVVVQVTVDEHGNVTDAKAISGHPLLQQAAVAAARQAKLSPTLLSGKPVKVTGTLTYNFKAE